MISVDLMLKLLPAFMLAMAAVEYLRRINNKLDDMTEMNWQMMQMLSKVLGQPEVPNVLTTRTGRVIRRKQF